MRPGAGREGVVLPPGGIYVLVVRLRRASRVRVGRKGVRPFGPGWYCYVGSAQRALEARLDRHGRSRKRRHWHIDGLTGVGEVVGAWVVEAPKSAECALAGELARRGEVEAGFGASDCGCEGHLMRFGSRGEVDSAVSRCLRGLRRGPRRPLWWGLGGQDFC